MNSWGFIFLLFLFLASNVLGGEDAKPQPFVPRSVTPTPAGGGTEALMQTLDETLAENRKLKEALKQFQEAGNRSGAESEILKRQIRTLQKQIDEKADVDRQLVDRLKKEVEKVKAEKKKWLDEQEKLREMETTQTAVIENLRQELREQEAKLAASIPEVARKQIENDILKIQESESRSVEEIADRVKENENLRRELAKNYYQIGNMHFNQQKYKVAAEFYHKSLALNPHDAWAHYNLGVVSDFYLNDREAAMDHYRRYLNAAPGDESVNQIKDRLLTLQLGRMVTPQAPLDTDFERNRSEIELRSPSASAAS